MFFVFFLKNWQLNRVCLLNPAVFYVTSTTCFSEVEFECFLMEHVFFFAFVFCFLFAVTSVASISFYPVTAHTIFLAWTVRAFECVTPSYILMPYILQWPPHFCGACAHTRTQCALKHIHKRIMCLLGLPNTLLNETKENHFGLYLKLGVYCAYGCKDLGEFLSVSDLPY